MEMPLSLRTVDPKMFLVQHQEILDDQTEKKTNYVLGTVFVIKLFNNKIY